MGIVEQPAREQNIQAIVDYCESGIKDACKSIGLELEHTLVYKNGEPVSYSDAFGPVQIIKGMSDLFPDLMADDQGDIVGASGDSKTITLEPGSQIELSAGPFDCMADARKCFTEFEERLEALAGPHDIDILTPGYHPTRKACDLELIPKRRYELMNEYLGAISMFGICMMRGSASTQASIDYTSEKDCLRKLRLANACVPVISLLTDNSPIFEAQPRPHKLMRTEIWEKCDPNRCGIIPGSMSPDFTFEDYAGYLLDTPAIFEITDNGRKATDKTFGEMFSDAVMSIRDVEHALSMLFNDVRLKTYVEIRPADAMPVDYVIAYAAMMKGLFYSPASLDALDGIFDGITEQDISDAKHSLMKDGYGGKIYGSPASEIVDEVMSIAGSGLCENGRKILSPLTKLSEERVTLADIAEKQLLG